MQYMRCWKTLSSVYRRKQILGRLLKTHRTQSPERWKNKMLKIYLTVFQIVSFQLNTEWTLSLKMQLWRSLNGKNVRNNEASKRYRLEQNAQRLERTMKTDHLATWVRRKNKDAWARCMLLLSYLVCCLRCVSVICIQLLLPGYAKQWCAQGKLCIN